MMVLRLWLWAMAVGLGPTCTSLIFPGSVRVFGGPRCGASKGGGGPESATAVEADVSEPCNVVLTTTNADFDSLAAACALASLWSHDGEKNGKACVPTHVVLPRGALPVVQRFLAYHKHVLPVRGFKTIDGGDVVALGVVDASSAARLGRSRQWLELAETVHVYDHHVGAPPPPGGGAFAGNDGDATTKDDLVAYATELVVEAVGSTTTLIVERLRAAGVVPSVPEATLYVLGIRADTGGLTYESTTARDADALTWLLRCGASQAAIADFGVERISETQRGLLAEALRDVRFAALRGLTVASVVTRTPRYVPGLAAVVEELLELTAADVFVMAAEHGNGVDLISRARPSAVSVDLRVVMQHFGGGGHARAAAAAVPRNNGAADSDATEGGAPSGTAEAALDEAVARVGAMIPAELTAQVVMTKDVVTLPSDATVADAHLLLSLHGMKSVPVVDDRRRLKGTIKLSDIVKAERGGKHAANVRGVMRTQVLAVGPETTAGELDKILVTTVGRVPVVDDAGKLLGIVTRTDMLRLRNYYADV